MDALEANEGVLSLCKYIIYQIHHLLTTTRAHCVPILITNLNATRIAIY